MKFRRHYQKDRILDNQDLRGYDIILTTYHTIMADWAGGHAFEDKPIFATKWRRIILDEGARIDGRG
jgi:SNF2 family DNA or RNA helicase